MGKGCQGDAGYRGAGGNLGGHQGPAGFCRVLGAAAADYDPVAGLNVARSCFMRHWGIHCWGWGILPPSWSWALRAVHWAVGLWMVLGGRRMLVVTLVKQRQHRSNGLALVGESDWAFFPPVVFRPHASHGGAPPARTRR